MTEENEKIELKTRLRKVVRAKLVNLVIILAILGLIYFGRSMISNTEAQDRGNEFIIGNFSGFCGYSTKGECNNDSECLTGGCSGQICQSVNEEQLITTCEYRECYNKEAYNKTCKCIQDRCEWG